MKITLTLTAGLAIDNLEMKGLETVESQKNWDNDGKHDHGRDRENKTSLEGLSGSAKGNFDMQINFDLQPEELQSCYSCIQELVKTVADSHRQAAEATEKVAEAVNKTDADLNPEVRKKVSAFMDEARKARETKDAAIASHALLLGYEVIKDLKRDGQTSMVADIKGIMDASLRKIINDADDHNV